MKNNFVELAIQKAVEGGWDGSKFGFSKEKSWADYWESDAGIFLDPSFWQALGKTEGWVESWDLGLNDTREGAGANYYQHRLIDAIQQGRSIDEFFGEILKK